MASSAFIVSIASIDGGITDRRRYNWLPDASREALEQADLGELTQTELAKHLGLSLPGAKSRVQRAREQLRTALVSCCAQKTGSDGNVVSHGCDCQPPDYCSKKSGKC